MNQIFKVIWSVAANNWIVVSELQKSKGKTKSTSNKVLAASIITTAVLSGTGEAQAAVSIGATEQAFGSFLQISAPASATGAGAIAIGQRTSATNQSSVALGDGATSSGVNAYAIGIRASASGEGSYAIGADSLANATKSIAIGGAGKATGEKAIAIGDSANASNVNAFAMGGSSVASGVNAVAVGSNSGATGNYTVAVGNAAKSTGLKSTVVGTDASASGNYATSLGANSLASGANSVASGYQSKATANNAVAVGNGANAQSGSAVAIGNTANVSEVNSVAIGFSATSTAQNALSLGRESSTSANYALSMGSNSAASLTHSVAIGSFSTTAAGVATPNLNLNDITYNFAGGAQATSDVVSVGGNGRVRQIQNVAAGQVNAGSTDAINGSQLHAVLTQGGWQVQANGVGGGIVNFGDKVNFISSDKSIVARADAESGGVNQIDLTVKRGISIALDGNGGLVVANTTLVQSPANMRFSTPRRQENSFIKADDLARHLNDVGFKLSGGPMGGEFEDFTVSEGERQIRTGDTLVIDAGPNIKVSQVRQGFEISALGENVKYQNNKAIIEDDREMVATVRSVAEAINHSGFTLKTSEVAGGQKISGGDDVINPGDVVEMVAGKNLTVKQENGIVTYGTKDDVVFTSVNTNSLVAGPVSINNQGINAGDKIISNVVSGGNVDSNAANIADVKNARTVVTSTDGTVKINKTTNGLQDTYNLSVNASVPNTTISATQGVIGLPVDEDAYVKAGNLVNVVNAAVNSARDVVVGGTNIESVDVDTDPATGAKTYTVNAKGAKVSSLTNEIVINPVGEADNITNYQVNLSDNAKTSLNNANTAIQDFTVTANGQLAKTVNKTNNSVNFVNGNGTIAKADGENITFDANVDGTTIVLENGKLKANIPTVAQKTTTVVEGSNTHVKQDVVGDNTQYTVHADKSTVSVADALKLTETEAVDNATGVKTTNYHVDLETATKDNIQKGVDAHTTVTTKGLNFNTENGQTGEKKLGETVNINGDGKNIQTKVADGNVIVELKNEIQVDKATVGNTVIDNAGVTINNADPAKTVSLTNNGLNNGGNKITNVDAGVVSATSTDAVNGSQLFSITNQVANIVSNNYWNLNANDQLVGKVNPTNMVNFKSTEGTVKITPKINNGSYDVDLDVKLGRGLTRNSTGSVEVSTTTINHDKENSMRFTTPRGMGSAYVTASDIARSLNEVGFKLGGSGEGDSFVDETDPDNELNDKRIINGNVFNLNAGKGVKITQIEKGYEVAVNNVDLEVENNKAKLPAGEGVEDKMVSAKSIVDTINNTGFVLTTSAANGGEKDISTGDEVINPSDKIDLTAGKNLKVKQDENGKIIYSTKDDVEFTSVSSGKVVVGNVVIDNNGIDAGNKKITNVEAGVNDNDAVNMSQLKALQTQTNSSMNDFTVSVKGTLNETINKDNKDVNFVDGDGTVAKATAERDITFDLSQTTKDNIQKGVDAHTTVTTKGLNFNTENGQTGEKKLGETVNINGDAKNIQTKVVDGNVIVELKNEIQVDKATVGNTVVDNAGVTINNADPAKTVSLTNNGLNNGGNKITNVADGVDGTDAVNVSQLNQKVEQLTTNINASKEDVKSTDKTVSIVKTVDDTTQATTFDLSVNVDSQTITKDADGKVKAITEVVENNTNGTVKDPVSNTALATTKNVADLINNSGFSIKSAGNLEDGNEDPAKLIKTGEEVIFEAGNNLTVKRVGNQITYATSKNVEFETVTANKITVGDVVINPDSVNMGDNKITNVAEGTDDKDAVNVSQLNKGVTSAKEEVKSTDKTVSIVKTVDDATQAATFDLSVNVDGQTITKDADGKVKAITEVVESNTNGTAKDPVSNTALTTVKNVVDLINNSGFSIKTAGNLATGNEDPAKLIKTGEEVIFEAGDNLNVKRVGNQITYATNKVVTFDKVSVGDVIISADNINMGDNKITNVAEGTDDKDAVNVSQLNQKVEELTTNINASKEDVKSTDKTVSIVKTVDDTTQATTFDLSVNVDGQTITKDADGKVKAITIDLENETNGTVKAPANNALVSAETVMNAINNSGFSIKTAGNLATGNEDPAKLIKTGEEVIFEAGQNLTVKRIGNQITYETAKNVEFETVKANGVQVGDISVTAEKIDMGGKKITNLADGVGDKDAVNVSQLNQKVEQLTTNINASKEKVVSTDNSVSINETIDDATQAITFDLSVHIDNQTIKKDNGALKVNTVALENNDNGTVKDIPRADQNALTTAKDVANAINNSGFSIKTSGNLGEGNEEPAKLVKTGQEVDFSAGKNLTVKRVGNQITYETAKNVEFENVKASGVQVGDISVTAEKIDMGGKNITNLAAGVNGTDAVNVDQLTNAINTASAASKEDVVSTNKSVKINKTVDDVTKATTFDLAVNTDNKTIKTQADGAISAITEELTVNENGAVNTPVNADVLVSGKTVADAINNSGFKIKSAGNKAQGDEANSKLIKNGEEVEFEAGDNLTVKRQGNKITYATAKNVAFESVKVKSKAGNTINIDGDSIALSKNGNTDPAKEVRLSADGLNNGGNRITNVADGVEDNDAATVRQLKQSQQGIINQINDKMDQIAGNINRNDKRLRAGVAGTNAAVGLPQVYLPGKSMVAASVGAYRGENAIAVGYSRASDNGKVILKLQGNANTRKDFGGSVGVGYQW